MSGRIIDADVDAIANIARLTAQVARLQEALTACEEKLFSYWVSYGGCGDAAGMKFVQEKEALRERVRALEGALRKVQEWAETCQSLGATNAGLRRLIGMCDDAIHITPAPKAETPAQEVARLMREDDDAELEAANIARDASVLEELGDEFGRHLAAADATIAGLRAEIAAANEEIARLKEANDELAIIAHGSEAATAGTTAKLGRAVAALRWLLSGDLGLRCYCHDGVICGLHEAYAARDDAESAKAGEAWAALMDTADELQKRGYFTCVVTPACGQCTPCRFVSALAAVDARRGGGR